MIFMHHPPFKVRLKRMDDISLLEPKAFTDAIAGKTNIRHLFFGHLHRPVAGSWRGIPISTLRATSHQVALDFVIEGRIPGSHEPPAYGVCLLEEDQMVVHMHDFLDRTNTFLLKRPRFSTGEDTDPPRMKLAVIVCRTDGRHRPLPTELCTSRGRDSPTVRQDPELSRRPQQSRRLGLGLELEIDLVGVDLGGRARREAAVGVERDARLVDALTGRARRAAAIIGAVCGSPGVTSTTPSPSSKSSRRRPRLSRSSAPAAVNSIVRCCTFRRLSCGRIGP